MNSHQSVHVYHSYQFCTAGKKTDAPPQPATVLHLSGDGLDRRKSPFQRVYDITQVPSAMA